MFVGFFILSPVSLSFFVPLSIKHSRPFTIVLLFTALKSRGVEKIFFCDEVEAKRNTNIQLASNSMMIKWPCNEHYFHLFAVYLVSLVAAFFSAVCYLHETVSLFICVCLRKCMLRVVCYIERIFLSN